MLPKVGDKVRVLVDFMTPAQMGDTATVLDVNLKSQWPILTKLDGRETLGDFFFTETEVELIEPQPMQLDLILSALEEINAKFDRLLAR